MVPSPLWPLPLGNLLSLSIARCSAVNHFFCGFRNRIHDPCLHLFMTTRPLWFCSLFHPLVASPLGPAFQTYRSKLLPCSLPSFVLTFLLGLIFENHKLKQGKWVTVHRNQTLMESYFGGVMLSSKNRTVFVKMNYYEANGIKSMYIPAEITFLTFSWRCCWSRANGVKMVWYEGLDQCLWGKFIFMNTSPTNMLTLKPNRKLGGFSFELWNNKKINNVLLGDCVVDITPTLKSSQFISPNSTQTSWLQLAQNSRATNLKLKAWFRLSNVRPNFRAYSLPWWGSQTRQQGQRWTS